MNSRISYIRIFIMPRIFKIVKFKLIIFDIKNNKIETSINSQ